MEAEQVINKILSEAEAEALRAGGASYAQGYLYAAPSPPGSARLAQCASSGRLQSATQGGGD